MKKRLFQLFLAASLFSIAVGTLAGCGDGKSGESSFVTSLPSVSSRECFSCHETNQRSVSKTSGVKITEQWQISAHNTAEGAGCVDCHGYHYQYITPANCRDCHASGHTKNGQTCTDCHGGGSKELGNCTSCHDMTRLHKNPPIANPDSAGKCYGCHQNGNAFKRYSVVAARHFNLLPVDGVNRATYVTANNQNACTGCHEPHNPLKGLGNKERKDWAESGHGNVTKLAWTEDPFATMNTCNACHTPTGFVKALSNGWTDTTAVNTGMQPLTCDGCHSSSNFKNSVRTLSGGYKAGMGGFGSSAKAYIQYHDVGESNLCIPCHTGRENGDSLKAAIFTTYTGRYKSPHYLAAAQTFYGVGGFQFYTSGVRYNRYGAAGKVGKDANWSHGKLGMDNYSASGNNDLAGKSNNTGNKGQCVACHLGTTNTHTFGAAEVANATKDGSTSTTTVTIANGGTGVAKPITRTCYGCHKGNEESNANGLPLVTIEQFIEEEKEIWHRMFDFYAWQLEQYGIYVINPDNPSFVQSDMKTAFRAWNTLVGTTFGGTGVTDSQRTMGTAMNLKLLVTEKGSFVHNRSFGRALIADSITYLQKGDVGDRSVASNDPNSIIKFSDYSSARPTSYPGQVGPNISIYTLKTYLIRTGGARGTFIAPFTRQ